jgi:hypothetical protein
MAVLAFYFWTAASGGGRESFGGESKAYYNLLAHGFRDGHLHMKVTPDPKLRVELPNRVVTPDAFWLLDASYYRGKYFLYFGAVPALTLFLPWTLITGSDFPEWAAVPLLASAAYLVALMWLARMRRRFFPRSGGGTWVLAVAVLGLANGVPVVLRRPLFYEVAETAGWLWSALGLFCLTRAVLRPGCAVRWLVFASGCAGLAVGSRPTLVVGGAMALALTVGWLRRQSRMETRKWVVVAAVPLSASVLALLGYNWARFENPLEFGLHYQLGSNGNGFPFTVGSLLRNLRVYYFTRADVGWFFPFVAPGPKPVDYYFEQVHGQFWFLPFLAFSVFAVVRCIGKGPGWIVARTVLLAGSAWSLGSMLLVAMAPVQSNRYALDFHPMLFTVALSGFLAVAQAGRRVWTGIAGGWLAGLMFLNVAASWHVHHFFQEGNPRGYERVARWWDRAVWPLWRWTNPPLGVIEASITFPAGIPGRVEPLVVAGAGTDLDTFTVHYVDPGHARLTFEHPGAGTREGPVFALRAGERRKMILSAGTFCPPPWHPWYDDLPVGAVRLVSHVRVLLDAAEVLALDTPCYPAAPGQITWGHRREPAADEVKFRGMIRFERGLGPDLAWLRQQAAESGPFRMRVSLPQDRFGAQEPLVITGEPERFDLVCVRYDDPHTIRVGMHHAGWPVVHFSKPLTVDYTQPHTFEVELGAWTAGAWLPVEQRAAWQARGVSVRLDGRTVLTEPFVAHPAKAWEVYVGGTPFAVSTSRRLFGGPMEILPRQGVSRFDLEQALHAGHPLRLCLRLPRDNPGGSEPLLTTGVTGKGDGLYVKYLDRDHVGVGFDHWGVGGYVSSPVAVDYDAEQELRISWGPLLARSDPNRERLRVELNGVVVLDAAQTFHPAAPGQIRVGLNPIGLSTTEAAFTGQILAVAAQ